MTAAVIAFAFLAGSIPFGYLIGRLYGKDIRRSGSGNIGAMNALRTMGKGGAVAVLVLDAAKGAAGPLIALHAVHLGSAAAAAAAAAAVLGHCFTPWLRGKGGKGVATAIGALLALAWPAAAVAAAGWVAGAVATRYSSAGSMLGMVLAAPALWYVTRDPAYTGFGIFAALFIVYTHRENIARLRAGTENRIRL